MVKVFFFFFLTPKLFLIIFQPFLQFFFGQNLYINKA